VPDLDTHMSNFLFSEVVNYLHDKSIKDLGDWLRYYSTDGNYLDNIVVLTESYYYKALRGDLESISMEEKILIYNAIALYSIEMDIDKPEGKIINTVILTFIEIIRHYNLFVKGYLSMKGDLLISDRNKSQFYSVWNAGSIKKEIPITLF
jgi:hypothetical protein